LRRGGTTALGSGGWNFGFALGPLVSTERFNDYYYQVSPQYAIPGIRPAYDARSGYSGALLVVALSKRFDHVWFGAFARYNELTGVVFENSPLVKTRHSFTGRFGFAWVLGESKTLVHASP
jgi:outer membrane scaffolding protein for murein synthesis (MipA/OmpV family)